MRGSEPAYKPKLYWEKRLSQHFDLKGVGNIGFSTTYNGWLYRRKRRCIEGFFRRKTREANGFWISAAARAFSSTGICDATPR
jgi:hypothetical protein